MVSPGKYLAVGLQSGRTANLTGAQYKFYLVREHLPDNPDELAGTVPEGIVVRPALRHLSVIVIFEGGGVLYDIVGRVHECVPEHSGAAFGHPGAPTDRQKGPDRRRQATWCGWRSGVCY